MKLAAGLCVWVSLLVAAGSVGRSASQSGGWRLRLALRGSNPPRLARLLGWPSLSVPQPDTPGSRGGGTTPPGPLPWALGRLSFRPRTSHLRVHAFYFSWENKKQKQPTVCAPLSPLPLSLTPLSSFSHVFWEPERDPFGSRLVCGTRAPQTPRERGPCGGEARTARAAGGRGSRAVPAGPLCAGGRRERRWKNGSCTCVCRPRPLRLPPRELGGVRPDRSPRLGGCGRAGGRALARGPGTPGSLARRPGALSRLTCGEFARPPDILKK